MAFFAYFVMIAKELQYGLQPESVEISRMDAGTIAMRRDLGIACFISNDSRDCCTRHKK
jgi:hypothetical protein